MMRSHSTHNYRDAENGWSSSVEGASPTTAHALERVRGLRQLSPAQLAIVARYVDVRQLPSGGEYQAPQAGLTMLLAGSAELCTFGDGSPAPGFGNLPLLIMPVGATLGAGSLWSNGRALGLRATEPASVGWLSRQQFEQLASEHPDIALLVLQGVLGEGDGRGGRFTRSMRKSLSIRLPNEVRAVPMGTPAGNLLPHRVEGLPVVAALQDEKAISLSTPLLSNCALRALTPQQWEGQRIQRRSLALVALEAGRRVDPTLRLKLGPSVGFGQRIVVERRESSSEIEHKYVHLSGHDLATFGRQLERVMREVAAQSLQLLQDLWPLDEASEYFTNHGFHEAEQLLQTWRDSAVAVVGYGEVVAIDMGPVVTRADALGEFHLLFDADVLLLVYGRRSPSSTTPTQTMPSIALSEVGETALNEPPRKTGSFLLQQAQACGASGPDQSYQEHAWLRAIGVSSIGSFNRVCIEKNVPEMIRVAEGFHEKRISAIADEIAARVKEIDIVSIAGPSSSGKSTFIRRLCVQLKVNGITPVGLGLDDYYVDRQLTPLDATGDYDFEALAALQLPLLHQHIGQLLSGREVRTPRYDFVRGKSEPEMGRTLRLGSTDVLVIEGIHGLNPQLLGAVPAKRAFRILVCPLMQLAFDHLSRVHASDVRLVRRIVRDRHGRGLNAAQTIERWPKVRAGERRYIYPYQPCADAVFDSSLVYELSVLRVYAERYLLEVPRNHGSYTTALRLMHLLDRFVSIYPQHVPATSILREFIGGSGFDA